MTWGSSNTLQEIINKMEELANQSISTRMSWGSSESLDSLKNFITNTYPKAKNVTVKSSGGDYTTITDALNSETGQPYAPVTILIDSGTYNEGNLPLKNYVNLIGVDRDSVIINYNGVQGDEVNQHVFGNTSAICTIKNLTAKGEYVKYVLHVDAGGESDILLEQVKFEKIGNAANYCAAIGFGLSGGQRLSIINSELIGTTNSSEQLGAIFGHNWDNQNGNVILRIENCYLHGANSGLELFSLGSNAADLLILRGNKISGTNADIVFSRLTEYGYNQDDWNIIAEGNEIDNIGQLNGSTLTFTQPSITVNPGTIAL